jgi:cbb3-type cytochrome oxidase maturation protein
MDVIYGLLPGMILLGLIGVGVFFWAARSGQFDDMEGEASRILMDGDLPVKQEKQEKQEKQKQNPDTHCEPDKKE